LFSVKLKLSYVTGKWIFCNWAALLDCGLELSPPAQHRFGQLTPEKFMMNSKSAVKLIIGHTWKVTACLSQNVTFRQNWAEMENEGV